MENLRYSFLGAALALLLVGLFAAVRVERPTEIAQAQKKHRVVFQITTPDTVAYRALTRQINNLLDAWPDAELEVVAHNKGIGLLEQKKSNVPAELQALQGRGVRFVACEQTLKQQKLAKTDILPLSGFVPRGLVEIIEKQEQGWAYIKAGF